MFWSYTSMTLLGVIGMFLIFIVLLQRGRGGGLAGAFGGLGGQSAFGTKAGDVFTKITVVLAVIWVILAASSGFALRADANRLYTGGNSVVPDEPSISAEDDTDNNEGKSSPSKEGTAGDDAATEDSKQPKNSDAGSDAKKTSPSDDKPLKGSSKTDSSSSN